MGADVGDRFAAAYGIDLLENARDMIADGELREIQLRSDLLIGKALGH